MQKYCGKVQVCFYGATVQTTDRQTDNKRTAHAIKVWTLATNMSQTRDQQRFTISEVAAVWHEPMGPQRIMWPSTRPLHRGKISRTQRSKVPLTSTMPRFCGPLCIHRAACTDLTSRYEYTQHFLRFTQCINYSNQLRLYMKTVLQSFIHCLLSLVAAGQYNTQICHTVSRLFFYRATRMHSADYAVARCLSV